MSQAQFPASETGCRGGEGRGSLSSGAGELGGNGNDVIRRQRSSPFIELFRTTPPETVCPNFYVLSHANGCAFQPACSYCYLKSSLWFLDRPRLFTNTDELFGQVEKWIAKEDLESYVLNAGNLSDSLAFESIRPLAPGLVELFRERAEKAQRPHTLLLVTKGGWKDCRGVAEQPPSPNVVVSFSVNSPEAAHRFERGAVPVEERLEVASALKALGWRIRIRLDPMIDGFDYEWVARRIAELSPERLTLGTLRAEPSLMKFLPAMLAAALQEEPAGLSRYPDELRARLYRGVLDVLPEEVEVGLCEETPEMWEQALGQSSDPTCNCGL